MEFKEMHIVCENLEQRNIVIKRLIELNYEHAGTITSNGKLVVATYDDGVYQTISHQNTFKQINYKDFMEKYAMTELQKTIEAAKKQGYTNKTLSNALGKYDGYIARIISKPQSEKLQKELVKNISELLVPAPIDDAMMISKQEYDELQGLRKELNHKNQVLDKRNDKYNLLEGEFNELKFHFDKHTKVNEGLIRTINELEQQNKSIVASNFELSTKLTRSTLAVEEFKNVVSKREARIADLEKDYRTRAGMHITSENKRKKERFWFIGITVAILVLFVGYYFVFNT